MQKKYKCENCKHESSIVHVDGYGFGDRLLEGVTFVVDISGDIPKTLGVTKDAEEYFATLSSKKWIKECNLFCKHDTDVFTCEKCGCEVGFDGQNSTNTNEGFMVKGTNFKDI